MEVVPDLYASGAQSESLRVAGFAAGGPLLCG